MATKFKMAVLEVALIIMLNFLVDKMQYSPFFILKIYSKAFIAFINNEKI